MLVPPCPSHDRGPVPRARRRSRALRGGFDRLEGRALLSAGPGPLPSRLRPAALVSGHRGAGPRSVREVVYRFDGGRPLTLDLLLPGGPAPAGGWPVVVAIHGGGWRRFDKEQYLPKVAALARAGFAVVAPDYTLSAPGRPSWPAAFADVQAAVGWVRSQAPADHFDPSRIAAIGESAGGNLAALLGTEPPAAARVAAVVDFFGPTDLARLARESPAAAGAVTQFLGGSAAEVPDRDAAASPVDHVTPGAAPMLLVQGTADPVVPPDQSEELAAALAAAGVPERLVLVPGAGHGFGLRVGGLDLLPDVVAFLDAAPAAPASGAAAP